MTKLLYNGEMLDRDTPCFKSHDRGLTLGHGLFETLLVMGQSVPWFDYHWQRLCESARLLKINLPFSDAQLYQSIHQLIGCNDLSDQRAYARVMVTGGEAERGILAGTETTANYVIQVGLCQQPTHANPYRLCLSDIKRNEHNPASAIKSISYLDNILARQQAVERGFDEAILLNTSQKVAECAVSNIFMVRHEKIMTPPIADGALPGIVRRVLIEKSPLPIHEQSCDIGDLEGADEIFITNALMGVVPVSQVEDKSYTQHTISETLERLLASLIFSKTNNALQTTRGHH